METIKIREMTSDEYLTILERKLARIKGSNNPTSNDLIKSINGMRSVVLYDVLSNVENNLLNDVSTEETDPLVHSDLLDNLHKSISNTES